MSDSRLRELLGDDEPVVRDPNAADWADGYGITSPDVSRYVDVIRSPADALTLELRELAASRGVEVLDGPTATLVSILVRSHRPARVLEVGTGIGLLTMLLARAVPASCTITSIDANPVLQTFAHEFLHRDRSACAVELRVGHPAQMLEQELDGGPWDVVVLGDPALDRAELLELVVPDLAQDGLLVVPWALRGGRSADSVTDWPERAADVDAQRHLNRRIAADVRLADVVLAPIGDGLLLARKADGGT